MTSRLKTFRRLNRTEANPSYDHLQRSIQGSAASDILLIVGSNAIKNRIPQGRYLIRPLTSSAHASHELLRTHSG
jgi:hypothetical protein